MGCHHLMDGWGRMDERRISWMMKYEMKRKIAVMIKMMMGTGGSV